MWSYYGVCVYHYWNEVGALFVHIWLFANACGAFASIELMARFYEYGYAVPFFHCVSAYPTHLRRTLELIRHYGFRVRGRSCSVQKVTWDSILES